jgi:hypothetical protein
MCGVCYVGIGHRQAVLNTGRKKMSDFEMGYKAYENDELYDGAKSDEWKRGYVKSIEDTLNDIFSMSDSA